MSSYYQPPVAPPPYGNPPPYGQPPAPQRGPKQFPFFMGYFLFLSPKLWRDVGRNWGGICFFYMLLLLLATWLAVLIPINTKIKGFVDKDSRALTDQIPHVKVVNGIVSIDKPEPYTITDPENGQPIVIFDTTGKTTAPPIPGVLVTRDSILVRDQTQTRTVDLKGQNGDFDSQTAHNLLAKLHSYFLPVGLPAMTLLWMIGALILMLLGGAIGSGFSSSQQANLSFGATMRLTAIAMTPGILLNTALAFTSFSPGCFVYLIDVAITLVVLFMAVKANAGGGGPPNPAWPPAPGYAPPAGYTPPPSYGQTPPLPPPPPQQWPPQQ